MPRLLVVSHPAVLAVNQLAYAALRAHGWDPWIVVPNRWRHEYKGDAFEPECLPELTGRVAGMRIILPGRVQRHLYVTNPARVIERLQPDVAFIEQEPTALPTLQWGHALRRARVPFGMQAAENLPRRYPLPARIARAWTLRSAAFVAARSPTAARLVSTMAPRLPTPVIPHHVPEWPRASDPPGERPFTVGFAGRLVPEKGIDDLLDAVAGLPGARLRLVGNGPLLGHFQARALAGEPVEIDTDTSHNEMAHAYAGFDVLALPSHTTPGWTEQFGRVLVEALWCGVPVVGSSSGEIPWVIDTTGGGLVFREGDVGDLRGRLGELQSDPELRLRLAEQGRDAVQRHFSVAAVAADLDRALRGALTAGGAGM